MNLKTRSRFAFVGLVTLVAVLGAFCGVARAQAWTQAAGPGPSARQNAAMAFDSTRGVLVLFGGFAGSTALGDTWEWDGTSWTQKFPPGFTPSARGGHAMAYDSSRRVVVMYGGTYQSQTNPSSGSLNSEMWEWNGTTWTYRAFIPHVPTARAYHTMASDPTHNVIVMFGGITTSGYSNETWRWNGSDWTDYTSSGPSPRSGAVMAYDPARSVVVLFGGYTGGPSGIYLSETWEFSMPSGSWTYHGFGPSARWKAAMDYDARRNVTVLFGGEDSSGLSPNLTWDWNGTAWTQEDNSGPSARSGAQMAYDAVRRVSVLFGGNNGGALGDTWFTGPAFVQPGPVMVREGSPASFSVSPIGPPTTYQWRRNGVPLSDGGAISGATTATLTISPTVIGDAGAAFDCDVTDALGTIRSNPAGLSVTPRCGSSDFNGDGDVGTDEDIEAFFRVLAGGHC